MQLTIISDLHLEFHADGGISFLKNLRGEVLVLAGDVGLVADGTLQSAMDILVTRFQYVVAVFGNHEYYNSDRETVQKELERLGSKYKNLHILEDNHVTIDGQRFIGSTLWFPDLEKGRPNWKMLNDFNVIEGFTDWVFKVNAKSMEFLHKNIKPTDVVVTHHIPILQGSDKKWWGSPLQPFFVCDMEKLIVDKQPKLWVFGHTHDSHDSTIKKTRLICNPFGYAGREENPNYDENLIVSV